MGNSDATNIAHIIAIWFHILGIALFVGPQFFLAFAWVPVSRGIADQSVRVDLMRKLTRRFLYIGGLGLVFLVAAGSYLISDWRDFYNIDEDAEFTSIRYGVLFIVKMSLFLVLLAALALHSFVVGPRLIDRIDEQAKGRGASPAEVRSARMASMAVSIAGLLLALTIMVLGVMMNTSDFSIRGT
ncbi:MAG: hypothetical protein ACKVVT_09770 [Dehalococcoidia bacterium]